MPPPDPRTELATLDGWLDRIRAWRATTQPTEHLELEAVVWLIVGLENDIEHRLGAVEREIGETVARHG